MSEKTNPKHKSPGYETSDARIGPILMSIIALFALLAVAFVSMYSLYGFFKRTNEEAAAPRSPLALERPLPPEPRLQVHPEMDWQTFRARQDSILNNVGWVSREAGIVRLPIERAMEMVLQRGFPVREQAGKEDEGEWKREEEQGVKMHHRGEVEGKRQFEDEKEQQVEREIEEEREIEDRGQR
ncbi:MAG: hypothetical protein ACE5IY_11675 [bacterium]